MSINRFTLIMPASAADTFEAFHNHRVRLKWDTLLSVAHMETGESHPSINAVSFNRGKGWKRLLAMRTRFVNYQPGKVAAAMLVAPTGLFESWAASMRHRDIEEGRSELIYSFSLKLRPGWLGVLLDPLANRVFAWEAHKRFAALAVFLASR
ncbi:hypothetical protein TUM18999_43300 [Pseudomonas tohonis]|uniref:SRPBCC family protein n=1 Tax=Pseudomonas tohonis TaxID=2725477 RepID=A0A6J4E9T1_9PSED|nr:hypothetical protein TUM18999_43300 [Pseudomonas tohonis]GJN51129.1 hypothetical protein TUM20286_08810 [Pseudomonas tohonis]